EGAASAWSAGNANLTVVRQRNPLSNGQPQATSMLITLPCHVGTVEALKNVWQIAGGDAHAGVCNRDGGVALLLAHRDADTASSRCVLDGVVKQNQQHLTQLARVDLCHHWLQCTDGKLKARGGSRLELRTAMAEDVKCELVKLHKLTPATHLIIKSA